MHQKLALQNKLIHTHTQTLLGLYIFSLLKDDFV